MITVYSDVKNIDKFYVIAMTEAMCFYSQVKKLLLILIFSSQLAFASQKQIQFEQTLQSAREYFKPIYQSKGKDLSILGEWDYDENNGKALAHTVDHYFIEIYGGA